MIPSKQFSIYCKSHKHRMSPLLRGRVFHVTSKQNFDLILQSGEIQHNGGNSFPNNGGAPNSFCASKKCISVCDFYNNKKIPKEKYMNDYDIFNQGSGMETVFLFLNKSLYGNLIHWKVWLKEKTFKHKVVPRLESCLPGKILLSDIDEIWFIRDYSLGCF